MRKMIMTAVWIGALLLTGCSAEGSASDSGKYQIVCTNFPEYDWTMQLIKGHEDVFEVTYLLKNGVDIHNYQPTAADMAKIAGCDLFLYVGGESEHWVPDALSEAVNPEMHTIRLLDEVNALEEETVEGMEAEAEEEEGEEEAPEYDEHVWLSVRNAMQFCDVISGQLGAIDPEHAADYTNNKTNYCDALMALDADFTAVHDSMAEPTLIVADRFPFRYFVEDYGYPYYAAFAGCSAETEASFETIAFLAQKADELGASTIFTIEGGNTDIADAVIASTKDKNQTIARLNSLQSVTETQMAEGVTYLSLMQENLNVLKEAAER